MASLNAARLDAARLAAAPNPELLDLFATIERRFATTELGPERWYLLALAALVGGGETGAAAALYLHLIGRVERQSPEARRALVRRLREALLKSVCIFGACKPIEAIVAIGAVEDDDDKDSATFTRRGWTNDEESRQRGREWLSRVYSRNLDATLSLFDDHKDFDWLSEHITYGLFLADRQVLDDVDTELTVLAGVMIQNLAVTSRWHIRGCRRIGISRNDTAAAWDCIQLVAAHLGISLSRVPRPEDVEAEV